MRKHAMRCLRELQRLPTSAAAAPAPRTPPAGREQCGEPATPPKQYRDTEQDKEPGNRGSLNILEDMPLKDGDALYSTFGPAFCEQDQATSEYRDGELGNEPGNRGSQNILEDKNRDGCQIDYSRYGPLGGGRAGPESKSEAVQTFAPPVTRSDGVLAPAVPSGGFLDAIWESYWQDASLLSVGGDVVHPKAADLAIGFCEDLAADGDEFVSRDDFADLLLGTFADAVAFWREQGAIEIVGKQMRLSG